ncbi:hypothetical protein DITRI_Ditri16bG0082900 [Diplodiscus trichospermus]
MSSSDHEVVAFFTFLSEQEQVGMSLMPMVQKLNTLIASGAYGLGIEEGSKVGQHALMDIGGKITIWDPNVTQIANELEIEEILKDTGLKRDDDIEYRNSIIRKEEVVTWEISSVLEVVFDRDKDGMIEVFKRLEEDDKKWMRLAVHSFCEGKVTADGVGKTRNSKDFQVMLVLCGLSCDSAKDGLHGLYLCPVSRLVLEPADGNDDISKLMELVGFDCGLVWRLCFMGKFFCENLSMYLLADFYVFASLLCVMRDWFGF